MRLKTIGIVLLGVRGIGVVVNHVVSQVGGVSAWTDMVDYIVHVGLLLFMPLYCRVLHGSSGSP